MNQLPPCHGVIPARYASSRFPGKPLALVLGRPMFAHVVDRARESGCLASVHLATDDQRIADAARRLGVDVVMTSPLHPSGTDRVYEAAQILGLGPECVVVNIQGDEPALDPRMLREVTAPFADPAVQVATLARPLPAERAAHPDTVKVVRAASGDALYFSRAPIPFARDRESRPAPCLAHVGLYAFRLEALKRFTQLPPSPLELTEQLEQLRFLENGEPIRVALTHCLCHGVDRPEDIAIVERLLGEKHP